MKAIIIEEDRFKEIVDRMKFEAEKMVNESEHAMEKRMIEDVHRCLHYHFVKWAQSHGASCT